MALLPILHYPDARLHKVAAHVSHIEGEPLNPQLTSFISDMFETMYEARGIGLAATQVDFHQRVIVIDVSEEKNQKLVLINPEILWASDERVKGDEGCLSVPGIYDGVERAAQVKISAIDENGKRREIEADGILAICIQHEMDHLMGKVFVEYLSPFKLKRIKSKLLKAQKEAEKQARQDN